MSAPDEPGGVVPPYEGRRTSTDPDQEHTSSRGGVRVGGATGPVEDDVPTEDQAQVPGGRTASPADEQPAAASPSGRSAEQGDQRTAHVPGTPRGEGGGA